MGVLGLSLVSGPGHCPAKPAIPRYTGERGAGGRPFATVRPEDTITCRCVPVGDSAMGICNPQRNGGATGGEPAGDPRTRRVTCKNPENLILVDRLSLADIAVRAGNVKSTRMD